MIDVAIRPARAGDARGIASVHVESWRQAYKGLVDQAVRDGLDIAELEKIWAPRLADTRRGPLSSDPSASASRSCPARTRGRRLRARYRPLCEERLGDGRDHHTFGRRSGEERARAPYEPRAQPIDRTRRYRISCVSRNAMFRVMRSTHGRETLGFDKAGFLDCHKEWRGTTTDTETSACF